jgi:hypothetical protein
VNQQLIKQKEFTDSILLALPNLLYVYNIPESTVTYSNAVFQKMLVEPLQTGDAVTDDYRAAIFHPDDIPVLAEGFEKMKQSPDGAVHEHRYRLKRAGGGWSWMNERGTGISCYRERYDAAS